MRHNHGNEHAYLRKVDAIEKFLTSSDIELVTYPEEVVFDLEDANDGTYQNLTFKLEDGDGNTLPLGPIEITINVNNSSNTGPDIRVDDSTLTMTNGLAKTIARTLVDALEASVDVGATDIDSAALGNYGYDAGEAIADEVVISISIAQVSDVAATATETVASEDYTITAPEADGATYNDYEFTLISSGEVNDTVVIAGEEKEWTITAGDNATAANVETALESEFTGDWTVSASDGQTGSDFDSEVFVLADGVTEHSVVSFDDNDGTTSDIEIEEVAGSATFEGVDEFAGLTIGVTDVTTADGDIDIDLLEYSDNDEIVVEVSTFTAPDGRTIEDDDGCTITIEEAS